ncbi:PqqD family peptide modification chaperone [Nordella sp. HKS 07]|uniref:PqqD family peptide modification chaperone n=1 Tax=Nordella sp. HKS 07 TaxID=2712222 RepID=UPI0013E19350|nr:PqqD family peptide modification chaperone [Nordella sp. HKS 07]QIG51074.1 PqqD family peptide modification chaperone [Nordella sp. HKS 07]
MHGFVDQPDRIATAPYCDGAVIYEALTGRLFHLNHTAARAWVLLREGGREAAIVSDLAREHGSDAAAVQRDLEAFIAAVHEAGLLRPRATTDLDVVVADPPQESPALDAAYRVGEVVVRVVCHSANVAAAFAPLAAPAIVTDGTAPEVCLTLYRDRGAFVLARDGRVIDRLATAPVARWAVVRQLVSAGSRRSWLALLHAGAVATPTGCLLVCGDSGAGKSTLLASLLHAGFGFVADDIVPLEKGTRLIRPVPLAISIKQGSWPVIGAMFPELAEAPAVRLGARRMRFLWPRNGTASADAAGRPAAAVLFPRYVKGTPVKLTRLDHLRSLTLLGEGGSILPSTDAGLAEFLAWWRGLAAYEISYGRLDDAVRVVRSLWDTIHQSHDELAAAVPPPVFGPEH